MLSSLMWPLAVVVVVVVFDKAVQLRKKKYVLSNCIIKKPCLFFRFFKFVCFFTGVSVQLQDEVLAAAFPETGEAAWRGSTCGRSL